MFVLWCVFMREYLLCVTHLGTWVEVVSARCVCNVEERGVLRCKNLDPRPPSPAQIFVLDRGGDMRSCVRNSESYLYCKQCERGEV